MQDEKPLSHEPVRRPILRALATFAFWTVIGLLYAVQIAMILGRSNRDMTVGFLVTGPLTFWYTWGVLSVGVIRLVRRFPVGREHRWLHLAVHVAAGVLCAFLHQAVYQAVHEIAGDLGGAAAPFLARIGQSFFSPIFTTNIVTYWMIVAGAHAIDYYRRYRERERQAAELEILLTRARLQTLQMQLHPHFLFNTLHTISSLMDDDPAQARQMMSRLSKLLRRTLDHGERQEVTLADELEMTRQYLEIEQVRFQDRLDVRIDAGEETLRAAVPAFFLQPLAENAIKHAVAQRVSRGTIAIGAQRVDGHLVVTVEDDGPEGNAAPRDGDRKGIGVANTKARLQELYGARQSLELRQRPDGGMIVRVEIPFHNGVE